MTYGVDFFGGDGNTTGNRKIDLDAAWKGGCRFVLRKLYQAPYGPDAGFGADWKQLDASPMVRGFYVFPDFRPNADPAKVQIDHAAAALDAAGGLKPGDLAPGFDTEFGGKPPPRSPAGIARFLEEFVTAMKDRWGCWSINYTSARVWDGTDVDCLRAPPSWISRKCPLWVKTGYRLQARQPLDTQPPTGRPKIPVAWTSKDSPGAFIQQYQGDALHVPGFLGTVDVNRFLNLNRKNATPADAGRVAWMQSGLVVLGEPLRGPIAASGVWDNDTDHALAAFQTSKGLDPDMDVGPKTFAFLSRVARS